MAWVNIFLEIKMYCWGIGIKEKFKILELFNLKMVKVLWVFGLIILTTYQMLIKIKKKSVFINL